MNDFAVPLSEHLLPQGWKPLPDPRRGCLLPRVFELQLDLMDDAVTGWQAVYHAHVVDEEILTIIVSFRLTMPAELLKEFATMIGHVNRYDCRLGNFDIDVEDGIVRYRLCHDLALAPPHADQFGDLVDGMLARTQEVLDDTLPGLFTCIGMITATNQQ